VDWFKLAFLQSLDFYTFYGIWNPTDDRGIPDMGKDISNVYQILINPVYCKPNAKWGVMTSTICNPVATMRTAQDSFKLAKNNSMLASCLFCLLGEWRRKTTNKGVRFLLLLWSGEPCWTWTANEPNIADGTLSHNLSLITPGNKSVWKEYRNLMRMRVPLGAVPKNCGRCGSGTA